jgi:hypothetical protein
MRRPSLWDVEIDRYARKFAKAFRWIFLLFIFLAVTGGPAWATGACPGNPNALGTSRVLTISPGDFRGIGSMQYRQTLPLNDHEVVITFDDGPLPPYSNIILDTLASQCVKATYFLIGRMAHQYSSIVRRIYNADHTIGTHTENHPHRKDHCTKGHATAGSKRPRHPTAA